MTELFEKYGYYREEVTSIAYSGVSAMADMAKAMSELRKKTIDSLADEKVLCVSDYLSGNSVYSDGRTEKTGLPKSDVLKFTFENEQFVCVRPSGTEPKLKVYVLCYAPNEQAAADKAKNLMAAIKSEL